MYLTSWIVTSLVTTTLALSACDEKTEKCTLRSSSTDLAEPTCDQQYAVEPREMTPDKILDEVVSIDRTNFPSFEEWRKLNLESWNQQNEEQQRQQEQQQQQQQQRQRDQQQEHQASGQDEEPLFTQESEGKVYKERFNYASLDCAATIMKTNTDTKGATNILSENKDTYLLNQCSSNNKFVVVELCNDILVDQISIANYEFFSSTFRHIRISVSDRFPVPAQTGWKVIGEFEGTSIRDIQHFHIKNPMIWARYVQIEFLSHWGHEYYCPVSLVRVHGTTMMDEYRIQEERKGSVDGTKVPQPNESGGAKYDSNNGSSDTDIVPHKKDGKKNEQQQQNHQHEQKQEGILNEYSEMFSSVNMNTAIISPLVLNESFCWDTYVNQTNNASSNGNYSYSEPDLPIQDSIYQTIMKRLTLLENNATLSLKYIEEQSQNLRDVLFKIEKKQNLRIEMFFSQFNNSVIEQLQYFQQQYSNLLMETVVDLERHRKKSEQDVLALSSRLSLLADEMIYQKKIGLLQAMILLVILIFVVTTRGNGITGPTPENTWSSSGASSPTARLTEFARNWKQTLPGGPSSPVSIFPKEADPSVAFMHSDSELNVDKDHNHRDGSAVDDDEAGNETGYTSQAYHLRSRSMPSLDISEHNTTSDDEDGIGDEEDEDDDDDDENDEYYELDDIDDPYPSPKELESEMDDEIKISVL